MQFGVTLPNRNIGSDPAVLVELACEAEQAGWDGVFVFDSIYYILRGGVSAVFDPWIALTAIAMQTSRIRIGPLATPLSRRRPWKVARETTTLDRLSHGRLILPVALGASDDGGFSRVGEELDRKKRAQMLDESLAILTGLWGGKPFRFSGEYYHVEEMTFLPPPVQSPRVPIWMVGAWPRVKSMRRALRWDGVIPTKMNDDGSIVDMTPEDIQVMKVWIDERRSTDTPFDIVFEGRTPGNANQAAAIVRPFAEAGATWWLEAVWDVLDTGGGVEGMRKRIKQGPPRL